MFLTGLMNLEKYWQLTIKANYQHQLFSIKVRCLANEKRRKGIHVKLNELLTTTVQPKERVWIGEPSLESLPFHEPRSGGFLVFFSSYIVLLGRIWTAWKPCEDFSSFSRPSLGLDCPILFPSGCPKLYHIVLNQGSYEKLVWMAK